MIVYIPYFLDRGRRIVMHLGDFPKPQGVDVVWYEVKFHQSGARVGSLSHLIFPTSHFPVIYSITSSEHRRSFYVNFTLSDVL
jgi:hypothetical protein